MMGMSVLSLLRCVAIFVANCVSALRGTSHFLLLPTVTMWGSARQSPGSAVPGTSVHCAPGVGSCHVVCQVALLSHLCDTLVLRRGSWGLCSSPVTLAGVLTNRAVWSEGILRSHPMPKGLSPPTPATSPTLLHCPTKLPAGLSAA